MYMKRASLRWFVMGVFAGCCLAALTNAQSPPLFSDDFDTDTSANWSVFNGSASGTPDFTAQFSFDYGSTRHTVTDPNTGLVITNTIPPAPNSAGGTTKGLKLTVNKNDSVAETAGVSVYPQGQSFSGNYALRFDMWLNYNGPSFGGTGSTEFGTFGINHGGDKVTWDLAALTDSDGLWFAVAGEGGASRDYRAYEGTPGGPPLELRGLDAAFLDRNADGTTEFEVNPTHAATFPLKAMFPWPPFETPGAPGKQWVQVEVAQRDGNLAWKMNGFVIAERPNTSAFASGNIMLGAMDVFSSIASPKEDNYIIFDNVRVVNLDAEPALPTVAVEATDPSAAEPGTDTGVFTISRTGGDQTKPLTVPYRVSGNAVAGADYQTLPGTAVIPANAASVEVIVRPIDDSKGEPVETVILTLQGNVDYEMRDRISATVELQDDGDVTAVAVAPADAWCYERMAEDTAAFNIYRLGDTAVDLPVEYTLGGAAVNGADYLSLASTAVIPAGATNILVTVTPIDDSLVEGTEDVTLTLKKTAAYVLGAFTNTYVVIVDDDQRPAPVLFADDFNTDTSANWTIRFGANNNIADYDALFAYDYSADSVPAAPHSVGGDTKGLRLTVNKKDSTASGAAGLNLYPNGKSFSGNFALRFDMFLNFNSSVAGTTEHAIFGVNHTGAFTNRHNTAGSDGFWFAIETDGSASDAGRSYTGYKGNPAGVPSLLKFPASQFAAYFTRPPYLAAGAVSGQWVDVEVCQLDGRISWNINGVPVMGYGDNQAYQSGNIMLGYMDSFNSIGAPENSVIYDNVRVVDLTSESKPKPNITSIQVADAHLTIQFTSATGNAQNFQLQSSELITGEFSAMTSATVQNVGPGEFQVQIPVPASPKMFFRINRVN
jgi:hypothetical protein